jgi:tetratricopeptide (TPR) repeat protein
VLCTARPELYERHPTWGGGTRNSTTVSLSPLSPAETERLVFNLLEKAVLPAETSAALLERSGGNPLYAEEYVKLFLEGDAAEELPMPDTVHGIIAARLDTLPPERKTLLQDAAVVGKVFWAGALCDMGSRDDDSVRAALHQLARKELVRPARASSVEDEPEYVFWHALIRDVAYGQIPRAQRSAKHIAAAQWIERIAGDRVADQAELIAHHYAEALAIARAAGDDSASELEGVTARFLVLAGDRALDLDRDGAEALYRRALDLLPAESEQHGRALYRLGEATQIAGRFDEARELVERAARELEEHGDPRTAGAAYGLLGNLYFQLGGPDRMEEALNNALRLLEPLPPSPELVEIYGRMGALSSMKATSPREALDWAEKAIAVGETIDAPREIIRALMWRGLMRCELGDLAGIEDLEHALAEAIALRTSLVVSAHVNLADQVWRQRGPAPAVEIFEQAIAYRVARGGTPPTWPQAETCWMFYDLGRWDELLEVVRVIRRFEEQHGTAQPGGIAQAYEALVLVWRGLLEDASAVMAHELPLARDIKDPQVLGPALVAAAFLASADGMRGAATGYLEEWDTTTRERPFFRSQNLTDATRIACVLGEVDLAERFLANVNTRAERDRLSDLTARATIADARGEDATSAFLEAAAGWEAFGCRLEHALALRGARDGARAEAILAELGAALSPAQTAARTAK